MLPKSLDTLRIDINSGKVRKAVSICQNDSVQRTLNFQLVDSGNALDIDNVLFAEILIHKADGYEADNGCVIDGDSIQYTLRTTDIAALGTNLAQLQLTFKDGQMLTTPTFEINVYSKVLDQRVQESLNEYTALTEKVVYVTELADQTEEAKNTAEEAASLAYEQASEAATYNSTYESLANTTSECAESASEAASQASNAANVAASETAENLNSIFSEYVDNASEYAQSASEAASNATNDKSQVAEYLASASEYASTASSQANVGSTYMTSTSEYMASASSYASTAALQVIAGSNYLTSTSEYASTAASEAAVANSCANGAEYWHNQTEAIAASFEGTLFPMGTVSFSNLPALEDALSGWMYNISDEFTTTSDFKEGAGHVIPLGTNIYKTKDGYWDVLAGSPVAGVKGNNENIFRKGLVNITKEDIGLGNVDNESLGSENISNIGDGSVKGAIKSLNAIITTMTDNIYPVGSLYMSTNSTMPSYLTEGRTWVMLSGDYVLKTISSGTGGETTNAGNTGSTTLTAAQSGIPAHGHGMTQPAFKTENNGGHFHYITQTAGATGGVAENNYLAQYNISVGSANDYYGLTGCNSTPNRCRTSNVNNHAHAVTRTTDAAVSNNTAANATQGHTHTAGMPANIGVYVWKRTA